MADEFLLEMTDIKKSFPGVQALKGVSLKVRPGTVHALMGENGAGKSVFMKCLFGIYQRDEGSILYRGKEVSFKHTKEALDNGISMVHQELNLIRERTVMDNIWLGRYPTIGGFVDQKKMFKDTKAIFERLNIPINPKILVKKLSVSEMQMVEIAKAVSYDAKIIAMDEPTSSLTEHEVNHLFNIIRMLKEHGCGIIYVSHKMEELPLIADEITIFRDGEWVATEAMQNMTTDKIIALMVGRKLTDRFPPKTIVQNAEPAQNILEVKNLCYTGRAFIDNVSFEVKAGEIFGIAGLIGARRTELLETIFGIREHSSGEILVRGKLVRNRSSREAIKNGFALVTEERRVTGILAMLDIMFNTCIANIKKYQKYFFLSNRNMKTDTDWAIKSMQVKTPSQRTPIKNLSGGNQQKVIIGRWLLTKPDILLLDEPTRGIDVGAKYDIYQLIINLAQSGKAILMVSSEMPELLGIADRIMVMSNGRVAGIVDAKTTTQEEILTLAAKYV